jgi:hypothetical protein
MILSCLIVIYYVIIRFINISCYILPCIHRHIMLYYTMYTYIHAHTLFPHKYILAFDVISARCKRGAVAALLRLLQQLDAWKRNAPVASIGLVRNIRLALLVRSIQISHEATRRCWCAQRPCLVVLLCRWASALRTSYFKHDRHRWVSLSTMQQCLRVTGCYA